MNMTAAEFKSRCLSVMDRINKTREAVLITKRGKPVARLIPVPDPIKQTGVFGCLVGTAVLSDDLIRGTGAAWNAAKKQK